MIKKCLVLSFLLLLASCQKAAEPVTLKSQSYSLTLDKNPESFPVNKLFEFTFKANLAEKEEVKVDCIMPGHGHGMNTQTVVEKVSDGVYKVKG
ncbi:MAG: hypothetical protein NE330_07585, partial [Lentisphaeraceae bacterium]|nr:hypothetical protein [Lentisphaeraceae bacterium]